jgi:hypothetical protein
VEWSFGVKVYVHWFLALQELSDWHAYWEGQPTEAQRERFTDLKSGGIIS